MARSRKLGDFLSAVEAELPAQASKCDVAKILGKLSPEDRVSVVNALLNPGYTGVAIARALTKSGHQVGESSVQRHRRRVCKCPKETS